MYETWPEDRYFLNRDVSVETFANNQSLIDLSSAALRFAVLADWGGVPIPPYYTPHEEAVAAELDWLARTQGMDFVLSLGDHFYFSGVQNVGDPRFKVRAPRKKHRVYPGTPDRVKMCYIRFLQRMLWVLLVHSTHSRESSLSPLCCRSHGTWSAGTTTTGATSPLRWRTPTCPTDGTEAKHTHGVNRTVSRQEWKVWAHPPTLMSAFSQIKYFPSIYSKIICAYFLSKDPLIFYKCSPTTLSTSRDHFLYFYIWTEVEILYIIIKEIYIYIFIKIII